MVYEINSDSNSWGSHNSGESHTGSILVVRLLTLLKKRVVIKTERKRVSELVNTFADSADEIFVELEWARN